MSKCILVDVDGTLADNSHRQHWVQTKPKNWPAFNAALEDDLPYHDIIWLVKTLHAAGCTILIVTARTGDLYDRTKKWLDEVAGLAGIYDKIYIRDAKDYRDDGIVKLELLDEIRNDGYDPFMVIDDRDRVVAAWRSAGIRCLQVQPGAF